MMTATEIIAALGQFVLDNGEDPELHGFLGVEGYGGPSIIDTAVDKDTNGDARTY